MNELIKQIEETQDKFVLENFNLKEIYEFTKIHKVEILVQHDGQNYCYIDYYEGDGAWAIDINPLVALIIGIKKYKEKMNENLNNAKPIRL